MFVYFWSDVAIQLVQNDYFEKTLWCFNSFCKNWKINSFYSQYFLEFSWYFLELFTREALYFWLINYSKQILLILTHAQLKLFLKMLTFHQIFITFIFWLQDVISTINSSSNLKMTLHLLENPTIMKEISIKYFNF